MSIYLIFDDFFGFSWGKPVMQILLILCVSENLACRHDCRGILAISLIDHTLCSSICVQF